MKNYILTFIIILFASTAFSQKIINTDNKKEGCIIGNCVDGYGVYLYKDSTRYEGNFKNNKAEGEGICYYPDGDIYIGNWKAHNFDGQGTFIYNGKRLTGEWKDGKLIKEKVVENTEKNVKSKVWALIIGVANYPNYRSLKYPDDDAYQLFSFLRSPEGGALQSDQIKILIDENATYQKITTSIEDIFSKADENDVVLFYFSGHGVNGAFLPHDYSGEENKLKFSTILDKMSKSKAKSKILIADACNSGSIGNSMEDELAMKGEVDMTISKYYDALGQSDGGTAMLLSSSANENSIERRGIRHGVFSYFLIEGLTGSADYDNNKIITVQEVFSFVKGNVQSYTNFYQNPMLIGDFDPNIPIGVLRD